MNTTNCSTENKQADSLKVWLVDDDDEFRNLFGELLGRNPAIQCARHFSSPDALLSTLASKSGPDVILLDVQMRERNGLDAVRPIKSLSRETRVLMLTTFYDPDRHRQALGNGASDFMLKTDSLEDIVERIQQKREPTRPPSRAAQSLSKPAEAECSRRFSRKAAAPKASDTEDSGWAFIRRLKFFRTLHN